MIGFIQSLQRRTPLGWLQLNHERGRLLVALAGIAFADILMFMQMGFQASLYDSNTRLNAAMNADIVLMSPQARNTLSLSTFTRRRLYQAMDVPGIKSVGPFYANTVNWRNPQTRSKTIVQVLGIDPDYPTLNLPGVNEQVQTLRLPDTYIFDRGARGDYQNMFAQIDRGQPVTTEIDKHTITVDGLFQMGASFGADGSLITSDQNFLRLFPRRNAGGVSLGLVTIQPGQDPHQIVKALLAHLPNDVKVLTRQEFIEFEKTYWQKNTSIGFIFSLGTAMAFVVGIVIVYQVLSTDVNAHIKEYATFKAMGYRNGYLLVVIFEEAIILAVLGFIPGVTLPLLLYQLTRNATQLPIYMTLARATTVLLLTVVMCVLSGAIATRKLQSADPADMF